MFIGRRHELAKLNEMHGSDKFECAIIYGRRRVGKTALIQEFIKDKKAIYYTGLQAGLKTNLENFSKSIFGLTMQGLLAPPGFLDFQAALDYIYEISKNERLILVIDEFPYLAEAYNPISSILQIQIDSKFITSKLLMILCGSSMSFMENQVLGYQSPLYGRRTAQFKIMSFDYAESSKFHINFDAYESATIYGITGGIPQYLMQISDLKSLRDNIIENFFTTSSYLYEEPSNILKQELREPHKYNEIITAIATGSSRLNEISTKTKLDTALCSKYITSLISLGIVKKEKPVLSDNSKKSIYRLADGMFRFWYRFVPGNASLINLGAGDRVYDLIESQIAAYMGEVFEEICKQYLWMQNKAEKLPFFFREAGRWWGANPILKSEQEIDIIAYDGTNAIFCECKWTNSPLHRGVLDSLIEKSGMFNFTNKYYYVFSKSGFADDFEDNISDNIRLIGFLDMFN